VTPTTRLRFHDSNSSLDHRYSQPDLAEAYTHAQLNALFMAAEFSGDAPEGNKIEKCRN
jgi:hypothetical protein